MDANDPAFLAETTEIRLSAAIQAQAATLNHDPVKIYHWVRNNIEWLPSMGAIQDADLTLASKRGNSTDIASLTISLLRASGIPSRYVHGTIEVSRDNFLNWAGGFTNINAAMEFAASGAVPLTSVISGGVITKVRVEHLWVEAAIDYQPSRGAKNFDADSWVQFDPSYKQYEYLQGLDAIAISGIDAEQLAQDFTNSGTINEAERWVSGFDPTILENAQAQAALEDHITNNMTDPTVGDVIGGRKTIIQEFPMLPSALPNKVITTGARYSEIPASLQQTITFSFERDITGTSIDPLTLPWAQLNNQRITLSFKPATPEDEAALASLLPEGDITDISQLPDSIPAYLINVIPELKLNGTVIKSGNIMGLGNEIDFGFDANVVNIGTQPQRYKVVAGSFLQVAVVGQSVSPTLLTDVQARLNDTKTKLESNDPAQIESLTKEELLGDMFHTGVLGYYAQYLALTKISGLSQKGHQTLMAGLGSYGIESNVDLLFGVPRAITSGGVVFNLPIISAITSDSINIDDHKKLRMKYGLVSSALEHIVPELMYTMDPLNPADAVSTVKAIQKATQQGQRIYHITPSNMNAALPNIRHSLETMTEISYALNAGKDVVTHTDSISVPGWSGAGYIILDPITGEGAYKISGGGNGGKLFLDSGMALVQVGLLGILAIKLGLIASTLLPFLAVSIGLHLVFSGLIELITDPKANLKTAEVIKSIVDTIASEVPKRAKIILDLVKIIVDSISSIFTSPN